LVLIETQQLSHFLQTICPGHMIRSRHAYLGPEGFDSLFYAFVISGDYHALGMAHSRLLPDTLNHR
jgi:hypothetical protein